MDINAAVTTTTAPYGHHTTVFGGTFAYVSTITMTEQDFGYASGPRVYVREVKRIHPVNSDGRLDAGTVDRASDRPADADEVAAYRAALAA